MRAFFKDGRVFCKDGTAFYKDGRVTKDKSVFCKDGKVSKSVCCFVFLLSFSFPVRSVIRHH